ncbi:hypothetical protein D3C72_2206500 [compost metagenome]
MIARPKAATIMPMAPYQMAQGMTTSQPGLPMSWKRLKPIARCGTRRIRPRMKLAFGMKLEMMPSTRRMAQLIQKCWRRRRPLKESMALLMS